MSDNTYTNFKEIDIEPPFFIGMVGPTRSGKTTLLKKFLQYNWINTFDNVIIFSPSHKFNQEYNDIEEHFKRRSTSHFKIITDEIENNLERAIEEQKKFILMHLDHPDIHPRTSSLYVLDDCIETNVFKRNRKANFCDHLAETGRHKGISVVATTQVNSEMSYQIRRNLSQFYLFAPLNLAELERILDEYVPYYMREKFRRATEEIFKIPHSFIIIDSTLKRRVHFRLRLRNGFDDYVFSPQECSFEKNISYINKS